MRYLNKYVVVEAILLSILLINFSFAKVITNSAMSGSISDQTSSDAAKRFCLQNGWEVKSLAQTARHNKMAYFCILPNKQAFELHDFYDKRFTDYQDTIHRNVAAKKVRYVDTQDQLMPDNHDDLQNKKDSKIQYPSFNPDKEAIMKIIEEMMFC